MIDSIRVSSVTLIGNALVLLLSAVLLLGCDDQIVSKAIDAASAGVDKGAEQINGAIAQYCEMPRLARDAIATQVNSHSQNKIIIICYGENIYEKIDTVVPPMLQSKPEAAITPRPN